MIYYLLTIVDDIKMVSSILTFFAFVAAVATAAVRVINIEEDIENIKRNYWSKTRTILRRKLYATVNKVCIAILAISLSLTILLPTSKGIAFIYVAPKLIENNNVKETFANIPELAKLGTDYLKELLKSSMKDTDKSVGESK